MLLTRSVRLSSEAASEQARTMLGIGAMVLAIFLFTLMDAIGKYLSASYPIQQVVWARYFFQLVPMLVLLPRIGAAGLVRTGRPGMQLARGLALTVATLCIFMAFRVVPLADAYTITFTAPLLVTILSIPLLSERVGWRRWSAVVVGFVGVLIVIRPGLGVTHPALALPLVTAALFAIYQILTRKLSREPGETATAMLFYVAIVGTVVTSAIAPWYWQPVAAHHWPGMMAMGALAAVGHLILIKGLTLAPASLLAPFAYTQIVWALAIGYLLFGDWPDGWMLVGCAVIVASGLFVFYREGLRAKS